MGSPDSCCDGLVCRENEKRADKKQMCLPPVPEEKKLSESTGNKEGCCSLDFVNCIDWCGKTEDSCNSCSHHDGVGWMPNGAPTNQCLGRWSGCQGNESACCDGMVCAANDNGWPMCQPSFLFDTP